VNSVRHALSLLGAVKIRNLVLGMQVAGLWKQSRCPEGWSTVGFNMHSAAVATLADMLAQNLPAEYPEGAFVAGLLHDLGRMLMAMGLPREFVALNNESARRKLPMIDCERELLGFTHAELSGTALRTWKLPEPIAAAVEQHHSAPAAGDGEVALSRVVCAADAYVNSIGLTVVESSPASEPDFGALLELGLAKARVEKLTGDFDTEFQAASQFFR
jgi:putative nucleotidyltransferase with HDIG domain